jgi:hypothetical protein
MEGIHRDIEIAQKEMRRNLFHLFYPDAPVIMEIYCIPSHNHHAFYLQWCEDIHNSIEVVKYARTEVYDAVLYGRPIYMYTFSDAINAQDKNRFSGEIVCGIFNADEDLHKVFADIKSALPDESRNDMKNDGIVIDGVLHWIRYEKNGAEKEYRYCMAEKFLAKSEYSAERTEISDIHNEIIESCF